MQLRKSDELYTIQSGDLSLQVTPNPYTLAFKTPKSALTTAGFRYQGLFEVPFKWTLGSATNTTCLTNDSFSNPNPLNPPPVVKFVNVELNISPGELFYGCGETFGGFTKNGQSIRYVVHRHSSSVIHMSFSVSGIKMEAHPVIRLTNVFRSSCRIEATAYSSIIQERSNWKLEVRRSAGWV